MLSQGREQPDPDDRYLGWRVVPYVSYRPKSEYKKVALKKRARNILANRTTNHWGEKLFPKKPGDWRKYLDMEFHPAIAAIVDDPSLLYRMYPEFPVSRRMYAVAGLPDDFEASE